MHIHGPSLMSCTAPTPFRQFMRGRAAGASRSGSNSQVGGKEDCDSNSPQQRVPRRSSNTPTFSYQQHSHKRSASHGPLEPRPQALELEPQSLKPGPRHLNQGHKPPSRLKMQLGLSTHALHVPATCHDVPATRHPCVPWHSQAIHADLVHIVNCTREFRVSLCKGFEPCRLSMHTLSQMPSPLTLHALPTQLPCPPTHTIPCRCGSEGSRPFTPFNNRPFSRYQTTNRYVQFSQLNLRLCRFQAGQSTA